MRHDVTAIQASRLADLVQDVARQRQGRLVNPLGDGATVLRQAPDHVLQLTLDVVGKAGERGICPPMLVSTSVGWCNGTGTCSEPR